MKEDPRHIRISEFNYPLPDERIAKFPLSVTSPNCYCIATEKFQKTDSLHCRSICHREA